MLTWINEFLLDMKAQKLRTTLTLFGIIWGTIAIVVLLAVGEGFKHQTVKNMHGMGSQVAVIFGGATTKAFGGFGLGRYIPLEELDASLLKQRISGIEHATMEYSTDGVSASYKNNVMKPGLTGVEEIYSDLRNVYVLAGGRWLNQLDIDQQRRVAVIGNKAKETLFGMEDAVGKTIFVGNSPFVIIGVMQEKTQNSNYGTWDADRVFIPYTTYKSLNPGQRVNVILYRVKDPTQSEELRKDVRAVLGGHHRFDPTDEGAIFIWDTVEADKFFYYFFLGLNLFLSVLGAFTLAVGGIGVANIMFIVVQERVKEIGIRRAMGATKSSIMIQFLVETLFIVGLGASIGFLMGLLILKGINLLPFQEGIGTPTLSFEVAAITISILMAIGLAAGLMPARTAANLDVVECLRA